MAVLGDLGFRLHCAGLAAAGLVAGDVENILDGRASSHLSRPDCAEGTGTCRQFEEGVEAVARGGHCSRLIDIGSIVRRSHFFKPAKILIDCEGSCPYIALAQSRTCLWASPERSNGEEFGMYPEVTSPVCHAANRMTEDALKQRRVRAFLGVCRSSIDRVTEEAPFIAGSADGVSHPSQGRQSEPEPGQGKVHRRETRVSWFRGLHRLFMG